VKPRKPATRGLDVALKTAKSRSASSQRWLSRQLNDPYVAAARAQGWRSRAAFKLLDLDDRFHLVGRGARVIDLGAAPGGWTQVAVKRGAGTVVGVDLLAMDPIPGAVTLQGDFTEPAMQARLTELVGGRADLVLSDMAPNTTRPTISASWRWPNWPSPSRPRCCKTAGISSPRSFRVGPSG
jgi:23S rRNA (uridine2552-2'-O)-methyltransferase